MVHLWASNSVAMMNVAAADSRRRSFPLCGPLPFSGANAAFGYLPLQFALQTDVRKLKLVRGKGGFTDKVRGNRRFVRGKGGVTDKEGNRRFVREMIGFTDV